MKQGGSLAEGSTNGFYEVGEQFLIFNFGNSLQLLSEEWIGENKTRRRETS